MESESREKALLRRKKRTDKLYQSCSSYMAEERGFEPLRLLQPTSFPSPPLQPLEYSSVFGAPDMN
jgi:hypothetical protein